MKCPYCNMELIYEELCPKCGSDKIGKLGGGGVKRCEDCGYAFIETGKKLKEVKQ